MAFTRISLLLRRSTLKPLYGAVQHFRSSAPVAMHAKLPCQIRQRVTVTLRVVFLQPRVELFCPPKRSQGTHLLPPYVTTVRQLRLTAVDLLEFLAMIADPMVNSAPDG